MQLLESTRVNLLQVNGYLTKTKSVNSSLLESLTVQLPVGCTAETFISNNQTWNHTVFQLTILSLPPRQSR